MTDVREIRPERAHGKRRPLRVKTLQHMFLEAHPASTAFRELVIATLLTQAVFL